MKKGDGNMSFPLERYKFYVNTEKRKVYAVSSYCGRRVCGTATCAPEDEFDLEKGKRLAAARCNLMVADKRAVRAANKKFEAEKVVAAAQKHYTDMVVYENEAFKTYVDACKEVRELLKDM